MASLPNRAEVAHALVVVDIADASRAADARRASAMVDRDMLLAEIAVVSRKTITDRIAIEAVTLSAVLTVLLMTRIVDGLTKCSVEPSRAFADNFR